MFTPVETSIGSLLLHQATSILLYNNGTVLGCSGFTRRLLSSPSTSTFAFFAGMAASIIPLKIFLPELLTRYPPVPTSLQAALVTVGIGALIGWGTKACNGCTSGHMLCGLSRWSARSMVAVALFFPMAILSHHMVHPSLLTEVCTGEVPCYTPIYPSRKTAIYLAVLATFIIIVGQTIPRLVSRLSHVPRSSEQTEVKAQQRDPDSLTRTTTLFLSGLQFGLGLHISQMASPSKVASFLSFPSMQHWDPSLALVLVFGVLPNVVENHLRNYPYINPANKPTFSKKFDLPKKGLRDVDLKFVAGAAVFGIGWGLSGTCPGPAVLRAFAQPQWGVLWFSGFWLSESI